MKDESLINHRGEIWGDLFPRYELAQYDKGLANEIGRKAFRLLDSITGPDVIELEYTTHEGVLNGQVIFDEDFNQEAA